jgi:peptidoglycan-associated lipoprotein
VVRNFLVQQGINAARIRTASFGKERPVAVCNDISCWSQNRRAQTVLNGRHDARS